MNLNHQIQDPDLDRARISQTGYHGPAASDAKVQFSFRVQTERNRTEPPSPVHALAVLSEPSSRSGSQFSLYCGNENMFEPF